MRRTHFLLQPFYLVLWIFTCSRNSDSTNTHFKILSGKKVTPDFAYYDVDSLSALHCANLCARNRSCLSASYDENSGLCRHSGSRVTGRSNQKKLTPAGSHWITLAEDACLDGWVKLGETCYIFDVGPFDYNKSKDACTNKSGILAEPPTLVAFELLRIYTLTLGMAGYWIGINDQDTEGEFVWTSNGLSLEYTAWGGTDPNGGKAANCGLLYWNFNLYWADDVCSKTHKAICQN